MFVYLFIVIRVCEDRLLYITHNLSTAYPHSCRMSFIFVLKSEFRKRYIFQKLNRVHKFFLITSLIITNRAGFNSQRSQLCITSKLSKRVFQNKFKFQVIQNAQQVLKKIVVKNPLKIDSMTESAGMGKTLGIQKT